MIAREKLWLKLTFKSIYFQIYFIVHCGYIIFKQETGKKSIVLVGTSRLLLELYPVKKMGNNSAVSKI